MLRSSPEPNHTLKRTLTDPTILKQSIRSGLGKYFFEVTQRKPVIVPVIMEV